MNNLSIIIRSANERTSQYCKMYSQLMTTEDRVHLIQEKPFAKAQIKSMEIAADSNDDYVLFLDADVIFDIKNAANTVSLAIDKYGASKFYMCNLKILDRQFKSFTYAGVHLYPKKTIQKALKYKDVALNAQKPETAICKEMAKAGYPSIASEFFFGFHGFEQYYHDLYRTAFVRAVKMPTQHTFFASTYWTNFKEPDYKVSLLGYLDGVKYFTESNEKASLNKDHYMEKATKALSFLNLNEKSDIDLERIRSIHDLFDPGAAISDINPLFEQNKNWLTPSEIGYNWNHSVYSRIARRIKKRLDMWKPL